MPGANVRALNELTGLAFTAVSDDAGRFTLPQLPVGFRPFRSPSFRLDADATVPRFCDKCGRTFPRADKLNHDGVTKLNPEVSITACASASLW